MMDLFGKTFSANQADLVLGQLSENMYNEFHKGEYRDYYLGHLEGYNEYYVNTTGEEDRINLQRSRFIDEVINSSSEDWNRGVPANSVLNNSEDLQLHRLRTAAYWEVSGILSMAFLPDFMRIPIIAGYNARLIQNLRDVIQRSVDRI